MLKSSPTAVAAIGLVPALAAQTVECTSVEPPFGPTVFVGPIEMTGDLAIMNASGGVFLYDRHGHQLALRQALTPSVVTTSFGGSFSFSGNRLAIGAPNTSDWRGAVFVFANGGSAWTEEEALFASDGEPGLFLDGDALGTAVGLEGDELLVGAPKHSHGGSGGGAVYSFQRTGGVWVEQAELQPDHWTAFDQFGASMARRGDVVVVSAPGHRHDASFAGGAAFVFRKRVGAWTQEAELLVSGAPPAATLGWSVAMDGDTILLGAPCDDDMGECSGSVFVFRNVAGAWTQEAKLTPAGLRAHDAFGDRVALQGDVAVVNSPWRGDGLLHVFERVGSTWTETRQLLALGSSGGLGRFGFAFEGETVLAGGQGFDRAYVWSSLTGNCEVGSNYCLVNPNSSGAPALMSSLGSASVDIDQLTLFAEPVPNQTGLFFYGPTAIQLPFGNSYRCVGGQLFRLPLLVASGGRFEVDVSLSSPPSGAGRILPGSTWFFQCWLRDPAAGGAFFTTSDGLSITFRD